jgi:hypothetical protein
MNSQAAPHPAACRIHLNCSRLILYDHKFYKHQDKSLTKSSPIATIIEDIQLEMYQLKTLARYSIARLEPANPLWKLNHCDTLYSSS